MDGPHLRHADRVKNSQVLQMHLEVKTWFCSEIFKEDDILVFVLPWSWRQYCRQSFNIFLTNALRASRPRSWTCAVIFALPLHIIYKQNWRSCFATKPCNGWALIHCRSSAITHSSCHCCPAITIWWLDTSPYRTTPHTTIQDTLYNFSKTFCGWLNCFPFLKLKLFSFSATFLWPLLVLFCSYRLIRAGYTTS